MVYCQNRACKKMDCIRRITYAPFDELIRVNRFNPKLKEVCEEYLREEEESSAMEVFQNSGGLIEEESGQMSLW